MSHMIDDNNTGNHYTNTANKQHHPKVNGFVTVSTADDYQIHQDPSPSPPLPAGISTPPPSAQNHPLLSQSSYREVHYPGDLSLRFVKPLLVKDGVETVHPGYSSDQDMPPPPPPNPASSSTPPSSSSSSSSPMVNVVSGHNRHHSQPYNYANHNQNHNYSGSNSTNNSNHHQHHYQQGHTTLPAKAVLIHSGPKSPLGKRSKSVTFSQPVAMVTPLNSESEESMESRNNSGTGVGTGVGNKDNFDGYKDFQHHSYNDNNSDYIQDADVTKAKFKMANKEGNSANGNDNNYISDSNNGGYSSDSNNYNNRYNNHYKDHDDEEPNYDNLQQMDVADKPLLAKTELITIPRWEKDANRADSPPRPMSTFQAPSPDEAQIVFPPPPPHDYKVTAKSSSSSSSFFKDPRLTPDSDDTAYMSDKDSNSTTSSSFWSPTKKSVKPLIMPKPQKAKLYQSGV